MSTTAKFVRLWNRAGQPTKFLSASPDGAISICISYLAGLYYPLITIKILSDCCVLVVQSLVVLLPAVFSDIVVNGFMNSGIDAYAKVL